MSRDMRPLRGFLFAPGNHARRVEGALSLDADAVILDLEDAVATAEKPATRELVAAAFTRPRRGLLYVRVNAADTEFCYGDLVAGSRADAIADLRSTQRRGTCQIRLFGIARTSCPARGPRRTGIIFGTIGYDMERELRAARRLLD
jgi:hypothetical protein